VLLLEVERYSEEVAGMSLPGIVGYLVGLIITLRFDYTMQGFVLFGRYEKKIDMKWVNL
jgi:hypothetical protein